MSVVGAVRACPEVSGEPHLHIKLAFWFSVYVFPAKRRDKVASLRVNVIHGWRMNLINNPAAGSHLFGRRVPIISIDGHITGEKYAEKLHV